MKLFEMPAIEVVEFSVEDVITTSSGGGNPNCPNEITSGCEDDWS